MEKLLLDLLAVPSVSSDRAANNQALQVLADYFADLLQAKIKFGERNDVRSLIVSARDDTNLDVILNGHIDVVPAPAEMFTPKIVDGKVYGRGASDMKGPVAAMAAAYKQLIVENKADKVALIITSDEEIGGLNGANHIVNDLGYFAPTVFLPDPGRGDWSICTDEKGGIWYLVNAAGKGAHSSRPWQGANALEQLMNAYYEIKQQFEGQWGVPTAENNWVPTLNLAAIHGGQAYNSVPEQAEMKLDCRFPAEVGIEAIRQVIESVLKKHNLNFTNPIGIAATHTEENIPAVIKWTSLVKQAKGFTPEFYKAHGSSDARFFSAKGMNVLMTKPTASDIHGEEEWVELKDLMSFKHVLLNWLGN